MKRKVSIILPTLNEEGGLKKTICCLPKSKMFELGYDLEILVIDGGSTDLTREIALQMGATLIVEKQNGYGRACMIGLKAANGEILVMLDADGTYPVELIPDYIQQLDEKDLDFITINRFSNLQKGSMTIVHKIGNKILSITISLLYSIEIEDSQSGMWIMRKSFLDRINLNAEDMCISEEIKITAFKFFKAVELSGKYYKRIGRSKVHTIQDGWKAFWYLFQQRKKLKLPVSQDTTKA